MSTIPADALKLKEHEAHDAHHAADHKPGFFVRWFMSTNHKDIGTLYLIFALTAGFIGGILSIGMRLDPVASTRDRRPRRARSPSASITMRWFLCAQNWLGRSR